MPRSRRAEVDGEGNGTDKSATPKKTEGDGQEGRIKEVDARVFDPLLLQATNSLVSRSSIARKNFVHEPCVFRNERGL
jgi:hypothetical protein